MFHLTLPVPIPDKEKKLSWNFYFHTSWCLKRFYEGLHKTFWDTTTKSMKIKTQLNFYFNTTCRSARDVKAFVRYFLSNFIFHQMIALQNLWKMFFISSKKLFSFSRHSFFFIFVFPSFFPVSHCFKGWFKKNLKGYDVINCLRKNLITHFLWYLGKEIRCDIETLFTDRVLNTGHFHGKIMQKINT